MDIRQFSSCYKHFKRIRKGFDQIYFNNLVKEAKSSVLLKFQTLQKMPNAPKILLFVPLLLKTNTMQFSLFLSFLYPNL